MSHHPTGYAGRAAGFGFGNRPKAIRFEGAHRGLCGAGGGAGVFITMAADVAAMAPHTRIGAAHPVELGTSGEVEKTDDTMKTKIENDTAAFAKSIAEKRHRNANWAMASVRESDSITAEDALQTNVIDLIASD